MSRQLPQLFLFIGLAFFTAGALSAAASNAVAECTCEQYNTLYSMKKYCSVTNQYACLEGASRGGCNSSPDYWPSHGCKTQCRVTDNAPWLCKAQSSAFAEPLELCPVNGNLSLSLVVKQTTMNVPMVSRPSGDFCPAWCPEVSNATRELRVYHLDMSGKATKDKNGQLTGGWQFCDGKGPASGSAPPGLAQSDPPSNTTGLLPLVPGPTLRLYKAGQDPDPTVKTATRLEITLKNELPVDTASQAPHSCVPANNYKLCYKGSTNCVWPPNSVNVPKKQFASLPSSQLTNGCPTNPISESDLGTYDLSVTASPIYSKTGAQKFPACFHGPNSTNLHFHGFHASPQPPQDFVLLSLHPGPESESQDCTPNEPCDQVGSYQYRFNPVSDNQAPGTHWYHPHKHGSTAVQVLNGMAGAILIEGDFDAKLKSAYDAEHVLVIQEVDGDTTATGNPKSQNMVNFFAQNQRQVTCSSGSSSDTNCACTFGSGWQFPVPLVNGQFNPTITMAPGEVQRWRFVGATMQATAQLVLRLGDNLEIRQIAQDGVPFTSTNYASQPLLNLFSFTSQSGTGPDDEDVAGPFFLGPGNRADFLVAVPCDASTGTYRIDYGTFGSKAKDASQRNPQGPPLLTVQVVGAQSSKCKPDDLFPTRASFPGRKSGDLFPTRASFPGLEGLSFYNNIKPGTPTFSTNVAFQMTQGPSNPDNQFQISGVQYCPTCANITMPLNETQSWTLTNEMNTLTPGTQVVNHPFHIHINPFQLKSLKGMYQIDFATQDLLNFCVDKTFDEPIWFDTISLPGPAIPPSDSDSVTLKELKATGGGTLWNLLNKLGKEPPSKVPSDPDYDVARYILNADIKTDLNCSSLLLDDVNSLFRGEAEILFMPIDFTGAYVLHCHILGHEDRGMMLNVQTVCGEQSLTYGNPSPPLPKSGPVTAGSTNKDTCPPTSSNPAANTCPVSYQLTGDMTDYPNNLCKPAATSVTLRPSAGGQ